MGTLHKPIRVPRGMNNIPEFSPSINENPPDTGNTAVLNAVLELKESFGGVRSDIRHLKNQVLEIKAGQKETNAKLRAVEDFQSNLKTWGKVIAGIATLVTAIAGLIGNWDKVAALLDRF